MCENSSLTPAMSSRSSRGEVSEMSQAVQAAEEEIIKFFEEKTYEGTRVTFNFQDIPVRSVLQLIADVSDLNIVVADSVGGNLTLRLTNVPWDQALDIVMDARNLDMRKNGNVLWIGPTAEIAAREQQLLQAQADRRVLEPLQTVLIPVSYAKAEDLATLITESTGSIENEYGLLSERGSVTVDSRTNTLLVTDTAEKILEIRDLVAELDYAVQQVQIESRIVIASSDFAHELGVRFGVTALHLGSNIGVIAADGFAADTVNPAINPRDDGLLDIPSYPSRYQVNLPAPSQNASTLGLSFLTGDVILDLELSALESEGEGEVISTPRVITANQAEAFIQQGVEIPYENSTSSGATAVQFKEGFDAEAYRRHTDASNNELIPKPLSLYVHLPFCKSLCYYCGCMKKVTRHTHQADHYLGLLDREIELQGALFDHDREVVQLHFGGGTPTFHDDAQLKALMEQLGRHFSLSRDDDREFSIEVDPRTVGAERLEHLAAIGFNRISLGIQDINPEVQKAVNRVQDTKATLEMIDASRRLGFNSVSVDLIYGLVNPTVRVAGRQ